MTIRTVGSGAQDHTTIQAAIDWYQTNWASADNAENFIEVFAGTYAESPDTNNLTLSNATKFVSIINTVGERPTITGAASGTVFVVKVSRPYHQIRGFELFATAGGADAYVIQVGGNNNFVEDCHITNPNATVMNGVYGIGSSAETINDCFISGFTGTSQSACRDIDSVNRVTTHNNTYGIRGVGCVATDCAATDSSIRDFNTDVTGNYNASSDLTAPGANSIQSIVAIDEFVSPSTNVFTLKTGSQLIEAGSAGTNNIGWDQLTNNLNTIPDPYDFIDQVDVALNTLIFSNTETITGITAPSPISITGGGASFSINGGIFTSTATTVSAGDTVQLRINSSASNGTTVSTTLDIGGVTDDWGVTTLAGTASYLVDLVDISLAESTTDYVAYGGGGAGLGTGADFSMQGTLAVDKQVTNAEKGALYDSTTPIVMTIGVHVYIWGFTATPGVTDTIASRGVVVNSGNSATNFVKYHVDGKDTFGAAGRVGRCYPIDPSVQTNNTGGAPYRTLVGAPNGDLQFFGFGLNTVATVKSANMGLDATRYGTGGFLSGGSVGVPVTFTGFSVENDLIDNRWGVFNQLFELQGKFVIGQVPDGTPTICYFDDSDKNIVIPDTPHSTPDFSEFIIDHFGTTSIWTNVNVEALGTNNKGKFTVTAANPVVTHAGGTFTNFGLATLRSNSTLTGRTWRNSDQIILNGGSLVDCLIEKSINAVAVVEDVLDNISSSRFIGDNTGHAVEVPTLIAINSSMGWSNTFDTATYAVVDGATGNEVIKVNVDTGITLTINVAAGATTPTINNIGAGTVLVVAAVPLKWTVIDKQGNVIVGAQVSAYLVSDDSEVITPTDTDISGEVSASYSGSTPADMYYRIRKASAGDTKYINDSATDTITTTGFSTTRTLTVDTNNNT